MKSQTEELNNKTKRIGIFSNFIFFLSITFFYLVLSCEEGDSDVEVDDNGEDERNETSFKETVEAFSAVSLVSAAELALKDGSVQPSASSVANSGSASPASVISDFGVNDYADTADYLGAVDPNATTLWYAEEDWSFYSHVVRGELDKARTVGTTEVSVDDTSLRTEMEANSNEVTWSKDNVYLLSGPVFVQDDETLTIEAGTVIKGKEAEETTNSTSLIIAKGGKIMAEGTAAAPIIFTFEDDPLDGTSDQRTSGRWGGLIILGKARLNTVPNEKSIEGIPTSESRGAYGGDDDADNSGVLRYVSVRHGGAEIGAGNEINGITLGGVGHRTILENIEVIGNKDDGIEFFGGTARIKWAIIAFCKDDSIDFDQGYRGFQQFVIIHQDPIEGSADKGHEGDGGDAPENGKPYGISLTLNLTSVGNPSSTAMILRDNAGSYFYNSIWMGYAKGVIIEDVPKNDEDSLSQFVAGSIVFGSCVFNLGGDSSAEDTPIFVRSTE